jgi:hypothetical protein
MSACWFSKKVTAYLSREFAEMWDDDEDKDRDREE